MYLDTSIQSGQQNKTETTKKAYRTPELVLYGNISEITRTVDNSGNADGPAGGNMDKT